MHGLAYLQPIYYAAFVQDPAQVDGNVSSLWRVALSDVVVELTTVC